MMEKECGNPDFQRNFDRLIMAGCDRQILSRCVDAVLGAEPPASQLQVRGGSAREIRARLARTRKASEDIRFLNSTFAGQMAALAEGTSRFVEVLQEYQKLPELICRFADALEKVAPSCFSGAALLRRGKQACDLNQSRIDDPRAMVMAVLAGYVFHATGRYHDEEVSALIGKDDPQTYKRWRERNAALVKFWCGQAKNIPDHHNP